MNNSVPTNTPMQVCNTDTHIPEHTHVHTRTHTHTHTHTHIHTHTYTHTHSQHPLSPVTHPHPNLCTY